MPLVFLRFASIAAAVSFGSAVAQSPHSEVLQLEASRSASVTCSTGIQFQTKVVWRLHRGITIQNVSVNQEPLASSELERTRSMLSDATYLDHVQLYCSGDQDGGLEISYVAETGGRIGHRQLTAIIRDKRLLISTSAKVD